MSKDSTIYRFDQIHIDVARNATDDFNPFHDPHRWGRVRGNPFSGPIALGFQLEALIDYLIDRQRDHTTFWSGGAAGRPFSNYEFRFAHGLAAGEPFRADLRRSIVSGAPDGDVSNRVLLRTLDNTAILIGSRTDTRHPRVLAEWEPSVLPSLDALSDRSFIADTGLFLKRKFLNNSNAKNFLQGSLVDQFYYFDELSERICFPAIFTASLISCALLEKAWAEGLDFETEPRVYAAHSFTIDRGLQEGLRSNDRLDILVDGPHPVMEGRGISGVRNGQEVYHCYGMLAPSRILIRAQVRTVAVGPVVARDAIPVSPPT